MKKVRRGFTLVELLIVVAIIGALAATMTMSSTDSIDSAGANSVISNLQSMKVAAMSMYMENSTVASLTEIKFGDNKIGTKPTKQNPDDEDEPEPEDNRDSVDGILGSYLGKKKDALGSSYGIVGDKTAWYVVYKLSDTDTAGMKTKLAGKASKADLLGSEDDTLAKLKGEAIFTNATTQKYVALRVR